MNNPEGVDVSYQPRLTWALGHTERGEAQTAYRVELSKFNGDSRELRSWALCDNKYIFQLKHLNL